MKVTVVLPVYNPGEGIVACLQSLRSQTLRNIEMIFVDDRGTDQAMALIREAAAQDARIRILVNEVNSGSGVSRNRGLEAARGEYVAFVDPDDYIAPDFLQRLYGKAQGTHPDIVKGECRMVDGRGRAIGNTPEVLDNDRIRRGLDIKRPIFALFNRHHWSAIYRRAFLMDNGVRYGLTRNAQDTTFLLRVGLAAKSIEFDDQAIYYYATRGDSRMRDYSRERLNNDLAAVREQIESLPACCEEQKEFRMYATGRIMYELRIQTAIAQKDPELGRWFLAEIRRLIRENPYLKQIQNRTAWLRALVQYGANLSVVPYKPQGRIEDVHAYVGLIRNWTEFLEQHASWTEQCRRKFAELVRQTFLSREMRVCSRAERQQVKREIYELVHRLPDTFALARNSLSMTLFVRYGIDCFRQIDWLKQTLFDA